jgi:two-component system, cell cycle response regulator
MITLRAPVVAGLMALAALAGALIAWWVTARRSRAARQAREHRDAPTAAQERLYDQLRLLGDTLSGTHDLPRIQRVVLQTARSALNARSGAVLVASAEGGELVGIADDQALTGAAPTSCADGSQLRLPLGTGLLGSVACGTQARRGTFGPTGPALAPGEPRGHSYLAVPLRRPGSVRGVLALYDRLGSPSPADSPGPAGTTASAGPAGEFDEFDEADLAILRTFAEQAAIAVENVRAHEEARRLSHTDPLTGLYNYRMLRESLRREVERANRFGHRLAVLVLDLDRFKEVNDSHGHPAGDAVLAEFARRLRAEIREVDLAFRQGGEEFVLLLPETDAAGGAVVAQRLCDAVRSAPMLVPPRRLPASRRSPLGRRVPVTVSVGVAVFPEHGATGAAVLQAADDALYAAKADGRDTHRVAEPRTGVVAGTGGGASGSPQPPRQSRGR